MRNLKPKHFTPEQEAAFLKTEAIMTRARIMERGVANYLNTGDYACSAEIAVAAEMLAESNAMRIAAEELRAKIRRIEMEESGNRPNPIKRRRRA
jgi:hypothetical protein